MDRIDPCLLVRQVKQFPWLGNYLRMRNAPLPARLAGGESFTWLSGCARSPAQAHQTSIPAKRAGRGRAGVNETTSSPETSVPARRAGRGRAGANEATPTGIHVQTKALNANRSTISVNRKTLRVNRTTYIVNRKPYIANRMSYLASRVTCIVNRTMNIANLKP